MKQRQRIALMAVAAIAVIAIGSRKVARHHERVRIGYELTEARRLLRSVEEDNRRLRLEVSILVSPERIKTLAAALGMRRPDPQQIRVIDEDGKQLARAVRLPEAAAQ